MAYPTCAASSLHGRVWPVCEGIRGAAWGGGSRVGLVWGGRGMKGTVLGHGRLGSSMGSWSQARWVLGSIGRVLPSSSISSSSIRAGRHRGARAVRRSVLRVSRGLVGRCRGGGGSMGSGWRQGGSGRVEQTLQVRRQTCLIFRPAEGRRASCERVVEVVEGRGVGVRTQILSSHTHTLQY